jgi:glucose/arabinose dehydrogenase
MPALLLAVAATLVGCGGSSSSTDQDAAAPGGYRFTQVASGLDALVHVTAAPGDPNRLYAVEQEGRIRILQNGRVTGTLLDIRSQVVCCGEQGLLSVAFHPRFARNGKYYVNYTAPENRVVEYRGRRALRTLLNLPDPYSNHNGGQNAFGPDRRLYVGTGDGGAGGDPENRSQDMRSQFGQPLTLDVSKPNASWQIAALGLRNAWRFTFDRQTGDLYLGDVGQNEIEEIDFTPRQSQGVENYGWDLYEGSRRFEDGNPSTGRLVFPIFEYNHGQGCSVTGGYVYRGRARAGDRGRYVFGDYCSGTVWSLRVESGEARDVRVEGFKVGSLTSFGEDAAGELYACSGDGTIYRLT